MAKKIEYKEGDKVGELTFVKYVKPYQRGSHRYSRAEFVCRDCQQVFEAVVSNVKSGNTTRCRKCANKLLRLPEGEATARDLYGAYKWGAKRRDIVFDLAYEVFKELTAANCTYCGQAPTSVHRSNYAERGANGSYTYNGIDRVNNDEGYTEENCVTCCATCNYAKSQMTVDEFLMWTGRVVDHHIKKQHSWWRGVSWAVNLLSTIRNGLSLGGLVRVLKGV